MFFDTNAIDCSTEYSAFFGSHRSNIEKISSLADIKIPWMVYKEVLMHKRKHFEGERGKIKKASLLRHVDFDVRKLDELVYDDVEKCMLDQESIPYEVVELRDPNSAFLEICTLVLGNKAPFDKGTDKGFKDACIVKTVDQFIAREHPEKCYLVSSDSRICDYYSEHSDSGVETVCDVKEAYLAVQKWIAEKSRSEDIVEDGQINEKLDDDNDSYVKGIDLSPAISRLCQSGSFAATHAAIEALRGYYSELTSIDKRKLLFAAADNQQINWILMDEDVADFYKGIFADEQGCLSDGQYNIYVDAAGLPNERLNEYGQVQFSRSERDIFTPFVDSFVSHIASFSGALEWENDVSRIDEELASLKSKASLDEKSASWERVSRVFLNGGVRVSSGSASLKELTRFYGMYHACSEEKQRAVIDAMRSRVELETFNG